MAIDTVAKRYSMIGFGSPVPRMLPVPDGTLDNADRAMLVYLYSGISLEALILATGRATIAFSAKQPMLTFVAKQPSISFVVTGE